MLNVEDCKKFKISNMNSKMFKQNGKLETSIIAIIIFVITLATNFSKGFFVEQSGNIQIFGNFGRLLVIGLVLKWKYIRKVVSILSTISLVGVLMSVLMLKFISIPFLILFLGLAIVFHLSTFSNSVKVYLNE